MKSKKIILILLILIFSFNSYAIEIKGNIYGEMSGQTINRESLINKDNYLKLNELKYFMRGNLIFKNEFNENANGAMKVSFLYTPNSYIQSTTLESIYIKEIYLDVLNPLFNTRIGKQYVKWGDAVFINPTDVINQERDPLRPIEEAVGNPFIQLSVPIESIGNFELLGILKEKGTDSIINAPFAAKMSFTFENISGLGFIMVKKDKKPVYGFDVNSTIVLNQESDLFVYSESAVKSESDRYRYENNRSKLYEDKMYIKASTGVRLTYKFPYNKRFDKITGIVEYYHDDENWNSGDLNEFSNYIESVKNDKTKYNAALRELKLFKNSKNYLYGYCAISNFVFSSLELNSSFIYNCGDSSNIIMPAVNYEYNDNTILSLKASLFLGGTKSEFGNNYAKNEISGSVTLAF